MTVPTDPAGQAALAICESLLLALAETKVIAAHEVHGVLADAAAVHREAGHDDDGFGLHAAAADLIEDMLRRIDPNWTPG
jgi:hypothetical protein